MGFGFTPKNMYRLFYEIQKEVWEIVHAGCSFHKFILASKTKVITYLKGIILQFATTQ